MSATDVRVVPKPGITLEHVRRIAQHRGWIPHNRVEATETTPFEEIWLTDDRQAAIHWIEDTPIGVVYLLVEGEGNEEIADDLKGAIDAWTPDELAALVRNPESPEQGISAMCHLAAAAPATFDADLFAVWEKAFGDSDDRMRRAAAVGSFFPGWPEFRAPLQQLRDDDTDPAVRELAGRVLESLEAKKWA